MKLKILDGVCHALVLRGTYNVFVILECFKFKLMERVYAFAVCCRLCNLAPACLYIGFDCLIVFPGRLNGTIIFNPTVPVRVGSPDRHHQC